jgi:hypothetical protein
MRRTEAVQGVRVAVVLNLLHRWESAELKAAELLGVSERPLAPSHFATH